MQLAQEPTLRTSGINSETGKSLRLPYLQTNKFACWFYTHIHIIEDTRPWVRDTAGLLLIAKAAAGELSLLQSWFPTPQSSQDNAIRPDVYLHLQ